MATLLLAEVATAASSDMTARALTAALEIGEPVDVLVAGAGRRRRRGGGGQACRRIQGAGRRRRGLRPWARRAARGPDRALAPAYDAIVAPSTASAKNVLPRAAALLDVMQVSDITKVLAPEDLRAADLRRQRDPDGRVDRAEGGGHGAHRFVRRDRPGRPARRSSRSPRRPTRAVQLHRRGARQVRPARADLGQDHHLGRPGDAEGGELQDLHRAGRRQARRGDGRLARRGRRGLCAERLAGRPDRQGGRAGALHRGRHFGRDPASRPA